MLPRRALLRERSNNCAVARVSGGQFDGKSTVKISVLFFGATADIAGTRRLDVTAEQDLKCDLLLAQMVDQFPTLRSHKLHISLNERYATGEEIIRDGDELAIFTAVSGG